MIKTKAGIDRADLSARPDKTHDHAVFFSPRGSTTCVGYFQHPPADVDVARDHLKANGVTGTVERLWATRDRYRAIKAEVYSEEIAADAADRAVNEADARALGRVWMQTLGLNPAVARDRQRMRNLIRFLNSDLFTAP